MVGNGPVDFKPWICVRSLMPILIAMYTFRHLNVVRMALYSKTDDTN